MSDIIDNPVFESNNGMKFELIDSHTPELKTKIDTGYSKGRLFIRHQVYENGMNSYRFKWIDVKEIDVEVLKIMKVWDNLPEEIQKDVICRSEFENKQKEIEKQQVIEHMGKMRMGRRKKYENIPKELTCIQCNGTIEVTPSILAKKIEKSGLLAVDYIAKFKCKRCAPPIRGRKANPALAHLPTELVCTCGNKISVTPSYIAQRAKIKGITPEVFVSTWKCQKCNPTKGRGKKKI